MNQVFEKVGRLSQYPAEILKFIGDAMLILLPVEELNSMESYARPCMTSLLRPPRRWISLQKVKRAEPGFMGILEKYIMEILAQLPGLTLQ